MYLYHIFYNTIYYVRKMYLMRRFHEISLSQHMRLYAWSLHMLWEWCLIKSSHKIIFCNIVKLICFDLESLHLIHKRSISYMLDIWVKVTNLTTIFMNLVSIIYLPYKYNKYRLLYFTNSNKNGKWSTLMLY